jgi:hypothetical protein
MAGQRAGVKKSRAHSAIELDDDAVVREGEAALQERLGTMGMLRFLRLMAGGRDRFEDLRKRWEGMTLDEALQRMGIHKGGEGPRAAPLARAPRARRAAGER